LIPSQSYSLSAHDARFADTWTKLRAFELNEFQVGWSLQIGDSRLDQENFQRVVLLDSDMLIRRNMDELMDLPLQANQIAAAHVCACNPRKLAHYPKDWSVNCTSLSLIVDDWRSGYPKIVRIQRSRDPMVRLLRLQKKPLDHIVNSTVERLFSIRPLHYSKRSKLI
jgi:hypothetical protein